MTGIHDNAVLDRLEAYLTHLEKWQRAINLVGPKTLADPWRRHILDSAQLVPLLPETPTPLKLADLGSGAGLPGLVLAIMTDVEMHLIESDQRKATFIREAARMTATTVTVHNARIEDVTPLGADVVTARALAPLSRLLPWVHRHLKISGKALLLKGAEADEELTVARKNWTINLTRKRSLSDASGTVFIIDDLVPITDV
ncbi:MAG: 16S rRNA (guanine(527)-N(7))-methyltransferase RsmG [Rhodospirillales bacterium]|nr:16S rRNA (guanine(527)-N(7))-methyltransferase RsmG [Rhodospirillales bacterium]MBO6787638.1 16S rRNA (guanine(527)-N(7))-methyltransferase RsmG [Rhodospirillales bacterium]